MIIRCKGCQSTVWLQPDTAASTACRQCGQSYSFKGADKLKTTGRRLAERARGLAKEHQIDLPGAYSMLLGIMTLDEVRAVLPGRAHRPAATPPAAPEKSPTASGALGDYDPEFASSVQAGRLTARQAMERGGRDAYAGKLARRHRLSKTLAYAVADNRMSLLQAIRKRGSDQRVPVAVGGAGSTARTLRIAAGLVVLFVLAAVAMRSQTPSIESSRSRTVGAAEITTDLNGRVLQVFGPDPRTVLRTYCREGAEHPFHALELVPHNDRGRRARLGLLRDPREPEALLAIAIREDKDAGHWVAGDGMRPLIAAAAPDQAARALRRKAETKDNTDKGTKSSSISKK